MLKFVTAEPGTFGHKRKQSQRACEHCRKRKKRCEHLQTSTTPSSGFDSPLAPASSLTSNGARLGSDHQHSPPQPQETQSDPWTGASRRSPNSELTQQDLAAASPVQANSSSSAIRHESTASARRQSGTLGSRFIGDLNPEGIFVAATSPENTRKTPRDDSVGIWLAEKFGKRATHTGTDARCENALFYGFGSVVQKILVPILEEECLSLLPPPPDGDALATFFFENIHPIFPVIDKDGFLELAPTDPARILLFQGVCLAASMNFSMKEHLRLTSGEPLFSYREFGRRIFAAMRVSMEIGLVSDKVVLIQALTLMSFFIDGSQGRDLSSLMCGRAVQYVQSLGLHIQDAQAGQSSDYSVTLLCCVWALDRLNAAFHGRPVLMHERDQGRNWEHCLDQQQPCFQLFLRVVVLLDSVIALYRPKLGVDDDDKKEDFLPFEDLLSRCAAMQVPAPHLATIETLYHAVAILSCRSRSGQTPATSSTSYLRQSLSAGRVTAMVGHECRDHLVLFPFVPYAVSLSLSIAYREMRRNKVPMYRARARTDLQNNCHVLGELGQIFWWASIMADVGKATLEQLDRAYSTVAVSQQRKKQRDVSQSRLNGTNAGDFHQSTSMTTPDNPHNPGNDSQAVPPSDAFPTPQAFDPFAFNDISELDVFEMFDTNFDIDGIDALLEGNLDLSFPTSLQ